MCYNNSRVAIVVCAYVKVELKLTEETVVPYQNFPRAKTAIKAAIPLSFISDAILSGEVGGVIGVKNC